MALLQTRSINNLNSEEYFRIESQKETRINKEQNYFNPHASKVLSVTSQRPNKNDKTRRNRDTGFPSFQFPSIYSYNI